VRSNNCAIAVIGIDIGKTRSTSWDTIGVVRSCFERSGRVARWRRTIDGGQKRRLLL